jgi:hypothetical protein
MGAVLGLLMGFCAGVAAGLVIANTVDLGYWCLSRAFYAKLAIIVECPWSASVVDSALVAGAQAFGLWWRDYATATFSPTLATWLGVLARPALGV